MPKVNEELAGKGIELCDFEEEDGSHILVWCQGEVSGMPEAMVMNIGKQKRGNMQGRQN